MEPTQTLPSKSTLSPNSFKHLNEKKSVKFDFKHKNILSKQGSHAAGGVQKIFQRRLSDKQKPIVQPLKMLFDTDPLKLLPIMNRKKGTDSPELVSTPLKIAPSSPLLHEPLNISDPLNLIDEEQSIGKASRKRKKKRLRGSSFCIDDDIMDLHDSHNKSLPLVSPTTETYPKLAKLSPTKQFLLKSTTSALANNVPVRSYQRRDQKRNYKHGNYIHVKLSGLEYKPLGQTYFPPVSADQRVQNFKYEWFKEKNCLEIGCGEGYITHWISKYFHPCSVVGVDIDSGLINIAKSQDRRHMDCHNFPTSLSLTHGPISSGFRIGDKTISRVDKKLSFACENYVPTNNVCLEQIQPKYDTIIFLNTSKWIHLNHGDDGLRRTFKKIFLQLKPGGRLLFEPQTYNCYKKSKNLTEEIRRNFDSIKFMPTDFITYLLSTEVGFTQSLCLAHTRKKKTSNARPLYLLTKGGDVTLQ